MITNTLKPIHIFRTGTHTDMGGRTLEFTESHLKASAAAYDPEKWAAPLVVGHPAHDSPSYGEVGALSVNGPDLEAMPINVDPAFAELVRARRFKSVSASFYLPDSPSNPVPGVYYPRHVGFLGAQPPALKGLRAVEFAANETGVVSFADFRPGLIASLFGGLRELIIEKFGREEADKTLPSYAIDGVNEWAQEEGEEPDTDKATEGRDEPITDYAENSMSQTDKERLAQLEAENAALKAANAANEKKRQADMAQANAAAFCESLIDPAKGAKITPAQRAISEPLLVRLLVDESAQPLEFGENEILPVAEAFKKFLNGLPVQVSFGEFAKDGVDEGKNITDPTTIAAEALAFMEREAKDGKKVELPNAVKAVMDGKHLAKK